jgi:hypothetical protein
MKHFHIGDLVYRAYRPVQCGKVKKITAIGVYFNNVEVAWINGKTSTINEAGLRSYIDLIAEHEKKLITHKAKLPKLYAL